MPKRKSNPTSAVAEVVVPNASENGSSTINAEQFVDVSLADTLRERQQRIAQAAFYRAERRGFAPGHELEDWLAAEQEVDSDAGRVRR